MFVVDFLHNFKFLACSVSSQLGQILIALVQIGNILNIVEKIFKAIWFEDISYFFLEVSFLLIFVVKK